jgi:hypothetical protein
VSEIYDESDALRTRALAFQTNLDNIKSVLDPLLVTVQSAEDLAYCGFIGDVCVDIRLPLSF